MTYSKLGKDTQTGQDVLLNKTSRFQGLYVIGATGTGKSGLFENLINEDSKQGTGFCVIDPHGQLIDRVIARLPANREQDVILLDITDYHYPFGLNLFACSDLSDPVKVQQTFNGVYHVFEKLLGVSVETPLILQYLRNCAYTLIANPGYTMADIPLLLQDDQYRRKLLAQVTDHDVLFFWRRYELMKPSERSEQAASILRRVEDFLQPLTRPIVGQSISTINLQNIMDKGKILLVKLDVLRLEQVSNFIGSLLIAQCLIAADARTKKDLFNIYVDEFQRFSTKDFATLFAEARKFGIGLTVAHQFRDQLDTDNKGATLTAANLIVFRVSSTDADELAGQFDTSPQPAREEVLQDEWFEPKIDELEDGVEPITTPVSDPFDWLQSHAHEDPVISRFALGTLRQIHLMLSIMSSSRFFSIDGKSLPTEIPPNYSQNVRADFNSFFYRAMISSSALSEKSSVRTILRLCRCLKMPVNYFGLTVMNLPDVVSSTVTTSWSSLSPFGKGEVIHHKDVAVATLVPDFFEEYSDIDDRMAQAFATTMMQADYRQACDNFAKLAGAKLRKRIADHLKTCQIVYRNNLLHPYEEEAASCEQEYKRWMTEERAQFETFLKEFRDFILALAQPENRIETGSGLYRPRKRTQMHYLPHARHTLTHPQRPHSDVRHEIANQLVGFPDYTARVKIKGEPEHTLQTIKPAPGVYGTVLQKRLADIQTRNRKDGYTRSRQDVEAEIRTRQNALIQGQQPPAPQLQPQQRRVLVQPQPVQPIASASQLEQELKKLWKEAKVNGLTSLTFEDWRDQPEQKLLVDWVKKLVGY